MTYEVSRTLYRLATAADEMPEGRVVHIVNTPGLAEVLVKPPHASERLLADLTEAHRPIMEYGRWLHHRPDSTDDVPASQIVEARWEAKPASELPRGVLCLPFESPGRFVWLMNENELFEQLIAEMNGLLEQLVSSGLWIQRWGGNRPTGD
jgi:hypothetical protein